MITVTRNTTHPWSGAPGWDRMEISASDTIRAVEQSYAGRRKMWHLFWQDGPYVIMYKPAGATEDWEDDDQWQGCDRDAARALAVGDEVFTNYAGMVTKHKIVARQPDFELGKAPAGQPRKTQVSQTGVLVKVTPDVPKSGGGWLDPAWFRRVGP